MTWQKYILLFFILGLIYLCFEVIFRVITQNMLGFKPDPLGGALSAGSLAGWSSVWMIIVGGLCGMLLGSFNQINWVRSHLNVLAQTLIGTLFVLPIEYISGYILNLHFKLTLWDYSREFMNLNGQICLKYAFAWLAICPFAFWIDDVLRWALTGEKENNIKNLYHIGDVYATMIFKPFSKPHFQNKLEKRPATT